MDHELAESQFATGGATAHRLRPEARAPRHDLYARIHKAMRLAMTDALARIGCLDTSDESEVRTAAAAVRDLIVLCRSHLDKEEKFVHPALEAAIPGAAGRAAREHDDHLRAFDRVESGLRAIERSAGAQRAAAAAQLYRVLALFTAENFAHMHGEEVDNNAVLWATFSDEEIAGIERRIVASIDPDQMNAVLRWMAPAMNPAERVEFFGNLRAKLPPAAFAGVMNEVIATLDGEAKRKLLQSLGA